MQMPPRTLARHIRIFRNTDIRRDRLAQFSASRRAKLGANLLQQCAEVGEIGWQPEHDPLLWVFRIRRYFREATLSLSDLEHAKDIWRDPELLKGIATLSGQHKALAAWALRHSAGRHRLYQICCELHHEVQPARRTSNPFPCKETYAWLAWFAIACGGKVQIPHIEVGSDEYHRDRWQDLSGSTGAFEAIQGTVKGIRADERARTARSEAISHGGDQDIRTEFYERIRAAKRKQQPEER